MRDARSYVWGAVCVLVCGLLLAVEVIGSNENAGNVAMPEQTKGDAADQELSKWAALQIHNLKQRLVARHTVELAVIDMSADKQARAKYWLNYFKDIKKNGVAK